MNRIGEFKTALKKSVAKVECSVHIETKSRLFVSISSSVFQVVFISRV